jgi:Interferon-induced transmembrane protein/zinc-ribbon domain
MFCPQCGTQNADNAMVCMQCGRTLQVAPQPVPMQPAGVVPAPGVYVQNYLVFAILATVLCCLPAGIPAIVYAAQVNGKLQAGDIAGAQLASKNAKMWCWIALGAGLGVALIYGLMIAVGVVTNLHNS